MLRLTLRQARSTAGRLLLAGVAVAMGTGFVAAVLLTSALFTRTISASVAAPYAGADVVVRTNGEPLTDAEVADVASAPSVAAADGRVDSGVQLVGVSGTEYTGLRNTAAAPALAAADRDRLEAGELPSASGEVALSGATADRLGVGLGGSLSVRTYPTTTTTTADGTTTTTPEPVDVPVTVVGLLSDDVGALFDSSGSALATTADALAWTSGYYTDTSGAPLTGYSTVLVATAPGASSAETRDAVADRLRTAGLQVQSGESESSQGWTGDAVDVLTTQQVVDSAVDSALGSSRILTTIVLAFAAVALFVATTVITNTFSVLVAQRTHQLALLRCVGATKRQVRRSVLAEAAALGVVASAVGVVVGAGLSAVAAAVVAHYAPGLRIPAGVVLTPAAVLAPLAVGTGATVVAALAPARAATRVSPLAALRPAAAPDLRTRTSKVRLASSLVLLLGGGVLLVGGVVMATGVLNPSGSTAGTNGDLATLGIAAAVLGGMASFSGVLLGAVFLVPRAVALVGRLVARGGGAPARLAALNAVRNPRRTASTTGALLIGTTLVALMVVGAATTSRTLAAALDRQFPVDVQVTSVGSAVTDEGGALGPAPLAPEVIQAASAVPGVQAWSPVLTTSLITNRGTTPDPTSQTWVEAVAASREQLASVLPDPAWVDALAPGTVVLPRDLATGLGVSDGDEVVAYPSTAQAQYDDQGAPTGWAGAAPEGHVLRVAVTDLGGYQVLVLPEDLTTADPGATASGLWMHLAADADPVEVAGEVQTAVTDATGTDAATSPVSVTGAAAERAGYQRVIDTMLLVVVGLLAVAVVIALVGVANTLSLSVIERTRENAVLRALGLTRGQLRRMLALEGALVAGVGGLLGVLLGSLYGWAGAASLLGGVATAGGAAIWTPELPWGRLALLLAVAVAAGLLASVLPARRAVRVPPVAALAEQ